MNIHRRICIHDFIVTTANLNQFSTNKIQFYWNNIYKNRAHTKKQWEKQRIRIEYIHNIHIYISLLLLFKLKYKIILRRGVPGWLTWLALVGPIQRFYSFSSTSFSASPFEYSSNCFIHIYEH